MSMTLPRWTQEKVVALIRDFSIIIPLTCSDQMLREAELFYQHR
jgi:hypothetical protein